MTPNPLFVSNFTVDWSLHKNITNQPGKFVEPISYTLIQNLPTVTVSFNFNIILLL